MANRHNLNNSFADIFHQYKRVFAKPAMGQVDGKMVHLTDKQGKPVYHYPEMPRITRSTLVLIQAITAGITTLQFPVLKTETPVGSTEIRLNLNDEFTITEISMLLYGKVGSATGPATNLSNRYWTYSPLQLSSTFLTIQPFYDSGNFTLTIDQVQYVRAWDTMQHEVIPRTQDNPTTVATAAIGQTNATLGSRVSADDSYVEMTPTIKLSGARTNALQITWPNGLTGVTNFQMLVGATASATTSNLFFNIDNAAILMRGFLAQNAAKFQGSQG